VDADKCIGCQLCYFACEDGCYQAIRLADGTRVPEIIDDNCVGCNLCSHVCPVSECISMERSDDGSEHVTWKDMMVNGTAPDHFEDQRGGGVGHFVPEPSAALKQSKHKT